MRKYKILSSNELGGLEEDVNKALRDGWDTVGGVSVVCFNDMYERVYYQAMRKREDS